MKRSREQGLRFARRIRALRILGLAVGVFAVAGVFLQIGAHPAAWAVLAFDGLFWPHLAWRIARTSQDPFAAEQRNLMIDSASGGVWVALMQFNLLPSVLLVVMLTMDKIGIGGPRFLAGCVAAQLAACVVTAALFGFEVNAVTTMPMIVACLPLLVVYPLMVIVTAQHLARRVREQNRMLAELSIRDGLTGLYNRVHWEERVEAEFERQRRSGRPAALLMIDIDHFKQVNDRLGHLVGDEVIRALAAILREPLRQNDVAGRYGGEEFGLLLPDTSLEGAATMAERIRRRVEDAVLEREHAVRCTVSIGIAVPADAQNAVDWIDRADKALYRAKQQGRNRCVRFEQVSGVAPAAR